MIKQYQITLMCTSGKYKPVSCVVKKDTLLLEKLGANKYLQEIKKDGVLKICQQRCWTSQDLKKYDYTRILTREYDKKRIEEENKKRYLEYLKRKQEKKEE